MTCFMLGLYERKATGEAEAKAHEKHDWLESQLYA